MRGRDADEEVMRMQWLLLVFGWVFIFVTGLMILVPYIRQRADLLTGWNLFLFGSINFVGISSIQSGLTFSHLYSSPTDSDFVRFVLGALAFYVPAVLTYYYFGLPRKLAARHLRAWGSYSTPVLVFLAIICLVLVMGYLFVPNVQFLGQFMVFFGINASALGIVFLLKCWQRRPFNVILLLLACVPFVGAAILSNIGYGRREFVAVLLTLPLCMYWWRWRYASPGSTVIKLSAFGLVGLVALAGISVTRGMRVDSSKSLTQVAVEKLRAIPSSFKPSAVSDSVLGGDTTDASLACIRYYSHMAEPQPFYTLYFIGVHPVPRAWWPDKPEALGKTLPNDLGLFFGSDFSIGPGIVGHGYHEGGIFFLIFYGVLLGTLFRFFDGVLVRESDNPYVIGTFCAISGHVLGLSRGDLALFIINIIAGMLTALLLSTMARIFFGTVRQLEPEPNPSAEPTGWDEPYGQADPYGEMEPRAWDHGRVG